MPPLNVGNVLHKSAVVGLIGVTLAWGSYIPIRLYVRAPPREPLLSLLLSCQCGCMWLAVFFWPSDDNRAGCCRRSVSRPRSLTSTPRRRTCHSRLLLLSSVKPSSPPPSSFPPSSAHHAHMPCGHSHHLRARVRISFCESKTTQAAASVLPRLRSGRRALAEEEGGDEVDPRGGRGLCAERGGDWNNEEGERGRETEERGIAE